MCRRGSPTSRTTASAAGSSTTLAVGRSRKATTCWSPNARKGAGCTGVWRRVMRWLPSAHCCSTGAGTAIGVTVKCSPWSLLDPGLIRANKIVECQIGCIPTGSIPTTRSTYHVPHDRDDETGTSTHIGPYLEGGEQEAITRHPHVALVGWKNPRRTAARGHGACRNNARSRSKSEGCSPGKPSADRTDGGCWGLQAPHCLCGRGQPDGRPGRWRG